MGDFAVKKTFSTASRGANLTKGSNGSIGMGEGDRHLKGTGLTPFGGQGGKWAVGQNKAVRDKILNYSSLSGTKYSTTISRNT